jgi:molecular chaperone DnaK (HSP70)
MADKYVFGIDLGTTYSCIAYVDNTGHPVVIQNSEGKNITPSVVQIKGDDIVVGETAKDSAIVEADSTISFVKRHMGESDPVFTDKNGVDYKAEEISALILRKICEDVKTSSLAAEVQDVVITCPAYFGERERLATANAGKIAGLNVMEVIKEPLAAAIHFGATKADEQKNYLVFDLGGGTFDVTIMKIDGGHIEEVCSDGNHRLGGKDWDDKLIIYLKDKFIEQVGLDIDFSADEEQGLRQAAEKAKIQLSGKAETQVRITAGGESEAIIISREIFDDLTASLLDQTFDLTRAAIEVAEQKGVKVDEILLVGGSTKMPQIREAIISKYGIEPKSHEPDEAVAKGAALYATNVYIQNQEKINQWIESGKSEAEKPVIENAENYEEELVSAPLAIGGTSTPITITTASTKSYGIAVVDPKDRSKEVINNMIFKNTAVPDDGLNITQQFGTASDNMVKASIRLFETDFDDEFLDYDEDYLIGSADLALPPNLPEGSPIEITLSLDKQGLLHVYGKDLTANNEVSADIQVSSTRTEEELSEMAQKAQAKQIKDF